MSSLAYALRRAGKKEKSAALYREILALQIKLHGRESTEAADAMVYLAQQIVLQGKLEEAEVLYREALAVQRKQGGDLTAQGGLLGLLTRQGKRSEAEAFLREEVSRDPENWTSLMLFSDFLWSSGEARHDEALTGYRKALELQRKDPNHNDTALADNLDGIGRKIGLSGKQAEGEALLREAVELWQKFGDQPSRRIIAMTHLAWVVTNQTESLRLLQEAVEMSRRELGQDEGRTAEGVKHLSDWMRNHGAAAGAEVMLRKSLAEAEARNAENGIKFGYQYLLGDFLLQQQRYDDAVPLLASALSGLSKRSKGISGVAEVSSVRNRLIQAYQKTGQRAKAAALLYETVAPGNPASLNGLAWTLATAADPEKRDGSNAVVYAEKAVALTSRTNAPFLDTLAAAYAELGQFDKAVAVQREAIGLLKEEQVKEGSYRERLSLYESSMPYREKPPLLSMDEDAELIRTGKFKEAVALYIEICKQRPGSGLAFQRLATLLMETGDTNAYRLQCHNALGRFADTKGMPVRRISRASLLSPLEPKDTEIAVRLAELALTQTANKQPTNQVWLGKGMADYRQGKFADAVASLGKAVAVSQVGSRAEAANNAAAYAVMASAQQQLKQPEKARASLAQAQNTLTVARGPTADLGASWEEILIAQVLIREARGLVEGDMAAK